MLMRLENGKTNRKVPKKVDNNPSGEKTPCPALPQNGPGPATPTTQPLSDIAELPVLAVHDLVLYPTTSVPIIIANEESLALIDEVLAGDKNFAYLVIRKEAEATQGDDETHAYDLYEYGCRAEILKMIRLLDNKIRLLVQGKERIKLLGVVQHKPYLRARVQSAPEILEQSPETEVLVHTITNLFVEIVKQIPYIPAEDLQLAVLNITSPLQLSYFIAGNMNFAVSEKQKILEETNLKDKLQRVISLLNREKEVLVLGKRIQGELEKEIKQEHREQILREQLRIIQKELGEGDERSAEIEELREKIRAARLPPEAQKAADDELNRLTRIPSASAEHTVVRTYLDWLITLPWSVSTEDMLEIKQAQQILDEDHYGLEKIKERILEYLAVRKLKQDMRGPILCFVGPPGVGKTSLGKSIARALGRKFYRMSLGGVRDEAEIRGHRRTYVGALPGRIIQGIRKAGSNNPLFMLDEVDKIGVDFRGDPSSALLEVLDPEQNFSFSDHYLEVAFDLSRVMFITTANVLDTVPPPLRDRMEVLELSGYTEEEKVKIARRYLIPKQLKEHGLEESDFQMADGTLYKIIGCYTREAGVRNLEREIATICRKIARHKAGGEKKVGQITDNNLEDFLGAERFYQEIAERTSLPGVATGLAWTRTGGDILFIESTRMRGSQGLTLTGSLGDVMKESAMAALSYIRSHVKLFKISENFFCNSDIHIHIPAGAIPKDGPSAGITIAISLLSLLTNKAVRPDVAMTGEITLRGKVLPVGGIKEKVLAARSAGIKTVLLPKKNMADIKEIPQHLTKGLVFHYIETIDEATRYTFRNNSAKAER